MEQIARLRKRAGLTQAALAKKLGVTRLTVSRWETGARRLTADTLERIAEALGCRPGDLFAQSKAEAPVTGAA